MLGLRAGDRHLKVGREHLPAGAMDQGGHDEGRGAVAGERQRSTVDTATLQLLERRAHLIPGARDLVDPSLRHEVLADPEIVGGGVADAGTAEGAGLDLIGLVRVGIIFIRADRLDHIVEGLHEPLVEIARHRERGYVRDEVRDFAARVGRRHLGGIAFVRCRLEVDLDAGMRGLELGDLEFVRGKLRRRRLRRPPAQGYLRLRASRARDRQARGGRQRAGGSESP